MWLTKYKAPCPSFWKSKTECNIHDNVHLMIYKGLSVKGHVSKSAGARLGSCLVLGPYFRKCPWNLARGLTLDN
jgi:hypothetical protein